MRHTGTLYTKTLQRTNAFAQTIVKVEDKKYRTVAYGEPAEGMTLKEFHPEAKRLWKDRIDCA
jgi:hypothetical protein